jgi:hypothetical protein
MQPIERGGLKRGVCCAVLWSAMGVGSIRFLVAATGLRFFGDFCLWSNNMTFVFCFLGQELFFCEIF